MLKRVVPVLFIFLSFTLTSCNINNNESLLEDCLVDEGIASWYGEDYHGTETANGEIYDMESLTAAHKTLPFNSMVNVKNIENGTSVVVRINNRGPFVEGRVIDLSRKAAREIDIITAGLAEVEVYLLSDEDVTCK